MDYKLELKTKIKDQEKDNLHIFLQDLVQKIPSHAHILSSLEEDQGLRFQVIVIAKRNFSLELDVRANSVEEIILLAKALAKDKLSLWHQTRFS